VYNTVDGETRLGVLYERHNEPEALSLPDVVYISYHKPAINAKSIGTSSTTTRRARQCTPVALMKSGSPRLSIRHLATTAPASALMNSTKNPLPRKNVFHAHHAAAQGQTTCSLRLRVFLAEPKNHSDHELSNQLPTRFCIPEIWIEVRKVLEIPSPFSDVERAPISSKILQGLTVARVRVGPGSTPRAPGQPPRPASASRNSS
jgi:hypothetical protein